MEFASRIRWILVIIFVVLALVIVGWGLSSIARSIFSGGSGSDNEIALAPVTEVTSAATARYTVDGPVVANEDHRSYIIEVSQNVVSMKVYKSYGRTVIAEKSYKNTPEAFSALMSSLDNLNVTERHKKTNVDDDHAEQGVCSNGRRYILELDSDLRRWNTSCSTKQGTAAFSMSAVSSLFKKQVPDYSDLVRGTGL